MTDATEKPAQPEAVAGNGGDKSPLFSPASVAGWLAIGGVLIIVISFVWEWGYWSFFGISLAEIPMSIENLASSVLVWMPFLLLTVLTLSIFFLWMAPDVRLWVLLWKHIDKSSVDERDIRTRIVDAIKPIAFIVPIAGIVALGTSYLYPDFIKNLPYGPLLFFLFFNSILRFGGARFILMSLFYTAILMWCTFYSARFIASEDVMYGHRAHIDIKLEANAEIIGKEVLILRNAHDFVYAYNSTNKKLLILPWRLIERISYNVEIDAPIRTFSIFRSNKDEDKNEVPVRPLSGTPTPRH